MVIVKVDIEQEVLVMLVQWMKLNQFLNDIESAAKAAVKFPSSSKTIERTVKVNGKTI